MGNETVFSLNCTIPPEGVHFVASPPVRGTLDIAWACLGVIVLSTWDALPVTPDLRPRARGTWAKLLRSLEDTMWSIVRMILVMLAPEYATAAALEAYFNARHAHRAYKTAYAAEDMVDWSMPKAYVYATKMFGVQFDESRFSEKQRKNSGPFHASGTSVDTRQSDLVMLQAPRRLLLEGGQMAYLRKIGVIDSFPTITDEEVADRNKTNGLIQFLTGLQVIWLVAQVIARYTQKLAVTQLEIATLAFAVLRFVTLVWDWNRPKGMKDPIFLYATRELTEEEDQTFYSETSTAVDNRVDLLTCACVSLVGALFGGLHCLAWNETFPTTIDRTLWRVAAVSTTCLPFLVVTLLNERFPENLLTIPKAVYLISRIIIVAETVRTLFYQPPSAFIATNVINFPHLG